MADFEAIIRKHVGEDGNIPTSAINAIVTAIKTAVGNEFVDKERYKAKLSEIETLKEQKQTAEDNATTAEKWKDKYDGLKGEFDSYKASVAAKETKAAKESAYKAILNAVNIPDKWLDRVMKGVDLDAIELTDKGEIKGADKLKESIKTEWADVIGTTEQQGADVKNPPNNNPVVNPVNPRAAELAKQFVASRYGTAKSE
jgi:hypothetical protein